MAAEFALAGGARGVARPAATLYSHIGDAGELYDVVSGSNGSCAGATACRASAGYDAPTGVGSPISLSSFAVAGAPANTSAPTVSGVAEQGQTLTASAGEWTVSPTSFEYHWLICNPSGATCSAIPGATGTTFTVPASAVGTTIRVAVGAGNASGAGTAAMSAQTDVVASNFPRVTGFSPASGITGSSVTITGTGFRRASQVTFGGLTATFTVLSPTQVEATVPNGAAVATISVATPAGRGASPGRFTPTLSVTGESPGRAAVGTVVTIKGLGFNSSSGVSFNGVPATSVTYVSPTTLKAVLPRGAQTGLITVTNSAAPVGTVRTAGSFVVA